jgi:hypothetical protein
VNSGVGRTLTVIVAAVLEIPTLGYFYPSSNFDSDRTVSLPKNFRNSLAVWSIIGYLIPNKALSKTSTASSPSRRSSSGPTLGFGL